MEVEEVNPEYSSVIGKVKYMERYGLSAHQVDALALARRPPSCREDLPCSLPYIREEVRKAHVMDLRHRTPATGTGGLAGWRMPIPFGLRPKQDQIDVTSRVRVPGRSRHGCWGGVIAK